MIDWTKSMSQTYEFYIVNPYTGMDKQRLYNVTGASVTRDLQSDTQVSGSIEYDGELGEVYVRVYLVAEQGDEHEKIPLITMLCQTPSTSFNGKYKKTSITGYSPLIELQNCYPPFGYTIPKYINEASYKKEWALDKKIPELCSEHMRMTVLSIGEDLSSVNKEKLTQPMAIDPQQSWFEVITSLINLTDYMFKVTPSGIIYFDKKPKINKMAVTWTYDTENSSILSSDVTIDRDIYNVPNVIEVIATSTTGNVITKVVENNDINSITSIPSRDRKVVKRIVNPNDLGNISPSNESVITTYANNLLEKENELSYKISYKHGYCPVNIGDCVRINYPDAGIDNVKALVISQKIDCKTGCEVEETAIFTMKLYESGGSHENIQ
jgi:hypothetical protein